MKKCDGNHSAAENARCFDIECWDDMNRAFNRWWWDEGSGMTPMDSEDAAEHVHRVARIAWANGAFKVEKDFMGLVEEPIRDLEEVIDG